MIVIDFESVRDDQAPNTPTATLIAHLALLDKLLRSRRRRVSGSFSILERLVLRKGLSDGLQEVVDHLGRDLFQVTRVQSSRCKLVFHLLELLVMHRSSKLVVPHDGDQGSFGSIGGDEQLVPVLRARRILATLDELSYPHGLQGEQDGLVERQDSIIRDVLLFAKRRLDLLLDVGSTVEKVNFGVGIRRRHFPASETGDHGVHQVCTLGVPQSRQTVLSHGEDFSLERRCPMISPKDELKLANVTYLIHASELKVDPEVLLIQSLHTGVQKTTQEGRVGLLDNLSTGLRGVVKGSNRSEPDIMQSWSIFSLVLCG